MDARRQHRFPARFPVAVESPHSQLQAQALNISRGGLLLTTRDPLPVGMLVALRFSLGEAEEILLKGLVRHASSDRGIGVEFVELLPPQQALLGAYLEKIPGAAANA